MRRRRCMPGGEAGFTLLELLITIAISAIVLSTITLAVAQGYSETSQASRRLDRSNLTDFAARIFAADAAGSATTQPAAGPCGSGPTILDIAESDGGWVSYAVRPSGTTYVLERRECDGADEGAGDARSQQLGAASASVSPSTAASSCPSGAGVTCTLAFDWADGDGSFVLSGTRRAG